MSIETKTPTEFRFTGGHMLAIMLAFFGVIVAVNVTMAMFASSSWTGLVVKNSYVASQKFNSQLANAKRQKHIGWTSTIAYGDGNLSLTMQDGNGGALIMDHLEAKIGRPAFEQADQTHLIEHSGGGRYGARVDLQPGIWSIRIAGAAGGVTYRRDARLLVSADGKGVLE